MYKGESVLENDKQKILWDFEIKQIAKTRRPLAQKGLVDFAIPVNRRKKRKENKTLYNVKLTMILIVDGWSRNVLHGKETGGSENQRKNRDPPDHNNIMRIG